MGDDGSKGQGGQGQSGQSEGAGGQSGAAPEYATKAELEALDTKLDKVLEAVSGNRGAAGDSGGAAAEGGRPADVREQVRAELERAQAERTEAERRAAAESDLTNLKAEVARLKEAPPAPPLRRVTSVMYGRQA